MRALPPNRDKLESFLKGGVSLTCDHVRQMLKRTLDSHRTFGRRPESRPLVSSVATPALASEPVSSSQLPDSALPSVEDEIAAWKAARGSAVLFPWRQLSLMAGLCFGVASFVLPATVNDAVQWPLYALTAVSLYGGLHKRKVKSQ